MYYIYILSNKFNNVIYVGVTNDIVRRVYEHKHKVNDSFTSRYNVNKLVYYEETDSVDAALAREKQIKSWNRERKNRLINSKNPDWNELIL